MNTGRTKEEHQRFIMSRVCEFQAEKLSQAGNIFLGNNISCEVLETQNLACLRVEGNRKAYADDFIISLSVHRRGSNQAITHFMPGRRTREETLAWLRSEEALDELMPSLYELSAMVDERA